MTKLFSWANVNCSNPTSCVIFQYINERVYPFCLSFFFVSCSSNCSPMGHDNWKPTNDGYISESIVVEILSWLAAKDLVRYKTVCKEWRTLIDDPYFIDLHKSRAKRSIIGTAKYAIDTPPEGEEIFLSSKRHSRLIGSTTHGLVCVVTRKNNYHICNPTTGKSFRLPPLVGNLSACEMRLYFIPQSRQLKVIALFNSYYHRYFWAVFTIGVDSKWRYLELYVKDIGGLTWWAYLLCENGPTYLTWYGHGHTKVMEIYRLDPYTEQLLRNKKPFCLDLESPKSGRSLQPHEWDGKFSISCIGEKEISTWILEDHKSQAWRNERVMIPRKEEIGFHRLYEVRFVQQGRMWLRSKCKTGPVFSLDLVTKKIEKITCNATRIYAFEPYQSTLEVLGGMK